MLHAPAPGVAVADNASGEPRPTAHQKARMHRRRFGAGLGASRHALTRGRSRPSQRRPAAFPPTRLHVATDAITRTSASSRARPERRRFRAHAHFSTGRGCACWGGGGAKGVGRGRAGAADTHGQNHPTGARAHSVARVRPPASGWRAPRASRGGGGKSTALRLAILRARARSGNGIPAFAAPFFGGTHDPK